MPSFHGIITPLITPLTPDHTLDLPGLARLIDHVAAPPVDALFILGSTGEAPSLPRPIREQLIQHAAQFLDGRLPLLVGVTDTCQQNTIALGRFAADHGAAGLVLAPPFYFNLAEQETAHYLAETARQLPLPVLLYHIPACTHAHMSAQTFRKLFDHPNILGIKDSSADINFFKTLTQNLPPDNTLSILVGPEQLLDDALSAGAHGGVPGSANLYPALYRDMYQAARFGDDASKHAHQQKIMQIVNQLYAIAPEPFGYIKTLKAALAIKHICSPTLAPPLSPLTAAQQEQVRQFLDQFDH